jgi:hypothetical protein
MKFLLIKSIGGNVMFNDQQSIKQMAYKNMIVNDPFEVILENVISTMMLENSCPFFTVFFSVENYQPTIVHFWTSDNYSCPKMEN